MDPRSLEDPEFSAALDLLGPRRSPPKITTALEYRDTANFYISSLYNRNTKPEKVSRTKHTIKSYDGAEIDIYHYKSDEGPQSTEPQPALIYAHGGGTIACEVNTITGATAAQLVSKSGVQCFAIEYRLAPEFPCPTPLEDCYAALEWVIDRAEELSVRPTRIGLIGESGGGCLVAGVSLLARDRGLSPLPKKQILIYPMLDNRSSERAAAKADPRSQYFQNYINYTQICWDAYLSYTQWESLNPNIQPYACPVRNEDLAGLPSTYIDVGALDLFRDESLTFATKLVDADVDVEFHLYDGVPHCFDLMAPEISITRNAIDNRVRAIRSL